MRPAVLIVDDVPDLLHLMQEAVAMVLPEHQVYATASGAEARGILSELVGRDQPLDLLIADQSLGDLNGLQLLAEARPTGARLVLVTGRATSAIESEAKRLGASVLWKPFRLHDLLSLLRTEVPDDA